MTRLALLAVLLAPALALGETAAWDLDPAHTHSGFTVRHLVINNVRGEFGKTTGKVVLDDKDVTKSSVEAVIDVTTVDTRVQARDDDLRSPNFFDAAKFPTITFKSTKVEKAGKGKLKVKGDLTIRDVTKPVVLEVTGPTGAIKDPMGTLRRGVNATTTINRKDFGLTWSKTIEAGPVVGDTVKIEIDAELVKAAGDQAAK